MQMDHCHDCGHFATVEARTYFCQDCFNTRHDQVVAEMKGRYRHKGSVSLRILLAVEGYSCGRSVAPVLDPTGKLAAIPGSDG